MTWPGRAHARRIATQGLAPLALAVILGTTLRGAPSQATQVAETTWSCVVCGDAGVTDVLLNLLLFMPLGLALRCLGWPWSRAIVVMLLLTLGIEAAQAFVLVGRDASLSDVLANTIGGALGYGSLSALRRMRSPDRPLARRVAASLLLLATATWFATGWGLRPEGSIAGPWVGQPLHRWPGHDPFPGQLQRVTLNGVNVPNDPFASVPSLTSRVTLDMHLTRSAAGTPERPVSLLRIVDATGRPQLTVTQRGEALLVSVRARASAWRVRTPTWRVDSVMAATPGVPWRLEWQWLSNRIELRSGPDNGTPPSVRVIPFSIGLGWAFVHPFAATIGSTMTIWWTVLWLALWGLPLGWCLGGLRRLERAGGVALTLAAYLAASRATAMPVEWWQVGILGAWLMVGIWRGRSEKGEARSVV